jgi:hypothetical protein
VRHSLLAVAVAAAALTACTSQPASAGPLDRPAGVSHLCVPLRGTAPVVVGDEALENHARARATIQAVRLVGPEGLTLTEAFLLPVANKTLLGTTTRPEGSPVWTQRVKAQGAVVDARDSRNLALVVSRSGRGSFRDVEVTYTADGHRYVLSLAFSFEVLSAGACHAQR